MSTVVDLNLAFPHTELELLVFIFYFTLFVSLEYFSFLPYKGTS